MKPYVSVIVPVYNNERYLPQCIESITNQTMKAIEIILLDDGSTDQSGEICNEYALKDKRIRVIHKQNEGLGLTRNVGISAASGEYFTFVDSDDYIALDMYEKLYEKIKKDGADVCIAGAYRVNEQGREDGYPLKISKDFYNNSEIRNEIIYQIVGSAPEDKNEARIGYSMCTGIYSLKVAKEHGMQFYSERIYKCEDILFKIEFFYYATGLSVIKKPMYRYRYNENSLTNVYREDFLKRILESYEKEFELFERLQLSKGRLFATRMLLADIRHCMFFILKKYGFIQAICHYKEIVRTPFLRETIAVYPYQKNPFAKRVFNFLIDKRQAVLLAVMLYIKGIIGGDLL